MEGSARFIFSGRVVPRLEDSMFGFDVESILEFGFVLGGYCYLLSTHYMD